MTKKEFIQTEIEHILNVLDYISEDEKIEMLDAIKDLDDDKLEKLLKTAYKVERKYLEYKLSDIKDTQEFLNKFK